MCNFTLHKEVGPWRKVIGVPLSTGTYSVKYLGSLYRICLDTDTEYTKWLLPLIKHKQFVIAAQSNPRELDRSVIFNLFLGFLTFLQSSVDRSLEYWACLTDEDQVWVRLKRLRSPPTQLSISFKRKLLRLSGVCCNANVKH